MYATADKEGEEDAALFEGSPEVIFIVLHSNAHVMMKVRDRREGGFFGTVSSALQDCGACAAGLYQADAAAHRSHNQCWAGASV